MKSELLVSPHTSKSNPINSSTRFDKVTIPIKSFFSMYAYAEVSQNSMHRWNAWTLRLHKAPEGTYQVEEVPSKTVVLIVFDITYFLSLSLSHCDSNLPWMMVKMVKGRLVTWKPKDGLSEGSTSEEKGGDEKMKWNISGKTEPTFQCDCEQKTKKKQAWNVKHSSERVMQTNSWVVLMGWV